eukprot:CAMPEP_0180099794 /NCGR_PEP_ID=MMETSP0985-20121206/28522_1 /TAXON_ID=483367 /ORGANISM="non described non described, Strain CCMP 2436" /LENGTH=148 /DNA_ID=CAMNT_0022035421 /DNA_START=79 /DNA_END=522 /DNA_ORIENTATION=+
MRAKSASAWAPPPSISSGRAWVTFASASCSLIRLASLSRVSEPEAAPPAPGLAKVCELEVVRACRVGEPSHASTCELRMARTTRLRCCRSAARTSSASKSSSSESGGDSSRTLARSLARSRSLKPRRTAGSSGSETDGCGCAWLAVGA